MEYSVELCRELQEKFNTAALHRPMRVARFDPGAELTYDVTAVSSGAEARVRLRIEKFVGGGFAGQVYQVRILAVEGPDIPAIDGLTQGALCAMKILIPPSGFSMLFRNLIYRIGFQGPFQLQVNPAAARAGAIWQKFIRRAARERFGDERAVVDIYATFVDDRLGSCGELSEWVDGRTWLLEVDDRLDLLDRWKRNESIEDEASLGSGEYRAKRTFMREFVGLLNDMGGYEFARQYEWSTCKSQPNCLKRRGAADDAGGGLVAVDFRAGLALLPFLPMSPGDFKLIFKGLARGSLVQFDRGDVGKLESFVDARAGQFADMRAMLEQLKEAERIYRNSIPDITHNHIRLFFSRTLWSTMLDSAVTGWRVRNLVDDRHERKLRRSTMATLMFFFVGIVPLLGKFVRRIWARADWRRHYGAMATSADYFVRAVRGKMAEKVIVWHRAGRLGEERAPGVARSLPRFGGHLCISFLPAGIHRFITDARFFREKLAYIFVRPVRLYFRADVREQWLRDMVAEGRRKHMLSDEDAETILSRIKEPFIQKYLKSLAVHVCTLPVTQVVSVFLAVAYVLTHPDTPRAEAWGIGAGIVALFQVVPISPGSLVRGLYVLALVIRERNFKDYNIAVFLGFFKYIGYLAFPIQMTYRYPVLARFMAAHWATEAVHIVPVFGERGALLEHWVFCLFYNRPLTIRRRMARRAKARASLKARYWHVGLCGLAAACVLGAADYFYFARGGDLPSLRGIWWLAILVGLGCGGAVTVGCGGAALWKRIVASAVCGILAGLLYTAATGYIGLGEGATTVGDLAGKCIWRIFILAVLSAIGALATELKAGAGAEG